MSFRIFNRVFAISNEREIHEMVKRVYRISEEHYIVKGSFPTFFVSIKCLGGKGGFGRALKQEGERRSRRLPHFKDSCRTLSGKRIGVLKAKRRIEVLKQKISEKELERKEREEAKKKSNVTKETQILEEKEIKASKAVQESVKFAIQHKAEIEKPKNFVPFDIDEIFEE